MFNVSLSFSVRTQLYKDFFSIALDIPLRERRMVSFPMQIG